VYEVVHWAVLIVYVAALIPNVSAKKNCCLMGCDTMLSRTNVLTFQRNLLRPSSAQMSSCQTIWGHPLRRRFSYPPPMMIATDVTMD